MLSIIQKRWIMLCLFVMMCVFGYYSWTQLSIEAYPDIADVTSQVVTQVPGLAAEEVEQQITIPLERAIYDYDCIQGWDRRLLEPSTGTGKIE